MCMEPISTVSLPGCYIATVNESETITVAKPFCPVGSQTSGPRAQVRFRFGFAVHGVRFKSGVYLATAHVERS